MRPLLQLLCVAIATVFTASQASSHPHHANDGKSIGLNHFYVVLDEATFSAVRDNALLHAEFAAIDTGLPNFEPPQADSQRIYIRGQTTYIELLGPNNPFGEPIGKVGIALGADDLQLMNEVKHAWSEALGEQAERRRIEWKRSDPPVPWYDVVQHPRTAENPNVVLWTSSYLPEFLPWLYPQRSARDNGTARADFLAPQFKQDRLLRDVSGLTIALPAELAEQITKQLRALGYSQLDASGGITLDGPNWTLTLLQPDGRRRGLLAIDMTTAARPADFHQLSIGPRSRITFHKGQATWSFE